MTPEQQRFQDVTFITPNDTRTTKIPGCNVYRQK